MDKYAKMFHLRSIMRSVHELAAIPWPDGMPKEALDCVIDIQAQVLLALKLPDDTPLTDGTLDTID
jgi:hypothetical protein